MLKFNDKDLVALPEVVEKEVVMPSGDKINLKIKPMTAAEEMTYYSMLASSRPDAMANALRWRIVQSVLHDDGRQFNDAGGTALSDEMVRCLKPAALNVIIMAIQEVNAEKKD